MTQDDDEQQSPPEAVPQQQHDVADVGYGNPPREHQFKPGMSGNPKGRPKGAKNESTILRDILAQKIENRSGGRVRKISVLNGILLRIADDALKGNTKSAAFILNRYAALVSGELQPQDLSTEDSQVLEAFARRLETRDPEERDGTT
jgi:hypothetical protein